MLNPPENALQNITFGQKKKKKLHCAPDVFVCTVRIQTHHYFTLCSSEGGYMGPRMW